MGDTRPALEYLLACSDVSLESFQISRMNQAANLRKQVRALVDAWVEAEVDAGLSRWMLECRRTDVTLSMLEADYPVQNKSLEHVMISFRSGQVEVSTVAARHHRLATGLSEVDNPGACLLLEEEERAHDECKNTRARHTKRLSKPCAKPLERTVAMPFQSFPKAQHELEFELDVRLVSGATGEEVPEATASSAAVERNSHAN
jgi:hypothetical protein